MIKHNQDGAVNNLLLPLIICGVTLISAIGFAVWAYSGKQDYKNNVDQKVADAVTIAIQKEDTKKDNQFAEEEKNPLRIFTGPDAYGGVTLKYPKTWSGYVDTTAASGAVVDGYFNPGVVPALTNLSSAFALRIQVQNQNYTDVITVLAAAQTTGKITVGPYALPKVPKEVGVKASGTFPNGKVSTVVYLPLRDKTLMVATDGNDYVKDFETIILPNLSFTP